MFYHETLLFQWFRFPHKHPYSDLSTHKHPYNGPHKHPYLTNSKKQIIYSSSRETRAVGIRANGEAENCRTNKSNGKSQTSPMKVKLIWRQRLAI